jgi:hypothetical protein
MKMKTIKSVAEYYRNLPAQSKCKNHNVMFICGNN